MRIKKAIFYKKSNFQDEYDTLSLGERNDLGSGTNLKSIVIPYGWQATLFAKNNCDESGKKETFTKSVSNISVSALSIRVEMRPEFEPDVVKHYYLRSLSSGLAIGMKETSPGSGDFIAHQQQHESGQASQLFRFMPDSDSVAYYRKKIEVKKVGTFTPHPAFASWYIPNEKMYWAPEGETKGNSSLHLVAYHSTNEAQKWFLTFEDGYFYLVNFGNGGFCQFPGENGSIGAELKCEESRSGYDHLFKLVPEDHWNDTNTLKLDDGHIFIRHRVEYDFGVEPFSVMARIGPKKIVDGKTTVTNGMIVCSPVDKEDPRAGWSLFLEERDGKQFLCFKVEDKYGSTQLSAPINNLYDDKARRLTDYDQVEQDAAKANSLFPEYLHHVAAVRDGSSLAIYVNGFLLARAGESDLSALFKESSDAPNRYFTLNNSVFSHGDWDLSAMSPFDVPANWKQLADSAVKKPDDLPPNVAYQKITKEVTLEERTDETVQRWDADAGRQVSQTVPVARAKDEYTYEYHLSNGTDATKTEIYLRNQTTVKHFVENIPPAPAVRTPVNYVLKNTPKSTGLGQKQLIACVERKRNSTATVSAPVVAAYVTNVNNENGIWIGDNKNFDEPYAGFIKHVTVWNKACSQADVIQEMRPPKDFEIQGFEFSNPTVTEVAGAANHYIHNSTAKISGFAGEEAVAAFVDTNEEFNEHHSNCLAAKKTLIERFLAQNHPGSYWDEHTGKGVLSSCKDADCKGSWRLERDARDSSTLKNDGTFHGKDIGLDYQPSVLPVYVEEQQNTMWCWAASALAIVEFFNPALQITQEDILRSRPFNSDSRITNEGGWTHWYLSTKQRYTAPIISRTIAMNEDPRTPAINEGVTQTKFNYQSTVSGATTTNELSFDFIKDEINQGLPVGVYIYWEGGGGHAVVLTGIYPENEFKGVVQPKQKVIINDPWLGITYMSFDDLVSVKSGTGPERTGKSYPYQGTGWVHQVFTIRPPQTDPPASTAVNPTT